MTIPLTNHTSRKFFLAGLQKVWKSSSLQQFFALLLLVYVGKILFPYFWSTTLAFMWQTIQAWTEKRPSWEKQHNPEQKYAHRFKESHKEYHVSENGLLFSVHNFGIYADKLHKAQQENVYKFSESRKQEDHISAQQLKKLFVQHVSWQFHWQITQAENFFWQVCKRSENHLACNNFLPCCCWFMLEKSCFLTSGPQHWHSCDKQYKPEQKNVLRERSNTILNRNMLTDSKNHTKNIMFLKMVCFFLFTTLAFMDLCDKQCCPEHENVHVHRITQAREKIPLLP
jgi:hypothetical protein